MVNRFLEKDIPYGKLANLGISKEKALSMPKDLLETFMSGKVTPLIQARVRSQNGTVYELPLKLQLVKDRTGNVQLMTYPVRKDIVSDISLNENERERLRQGDTIRKEVKEDGVRRMQFIQMDTETKSLIKRNVNLSSSSMPLLPIKASHSSLRRESLAYSRRKLCIRSSWSVKALTISNFSLTGKPGSPSISFDGWQ